jgi:hypothetical protein
MPSVPKPPKPFLEVRAERLDLDPTLVALCAGYEQGKWRAEQLAKHLLQWLPEFALRYSEWKDLDASNAVELIGLAAQSIYKSKKYKNRGEFGEILLHAILRQHEGSIPAISKYFFKDSSNDTVKGFDAVHVVARDGKFELWLGEAKLYPNFARAVAQALVSLEEHLRRDYLRSEFAAISNKLDAAWEDAVRLRELLSQSTSLDKIFASICIPVLITYDSKTVRSNSEVCAQYETAFRDEVEKSRNLFEAKYRALLKRKKLPPTVTVRLYLLPIHTKAALVRLMDESLKKVQSLA